MSNVIDLTVREPKVIWTFTADEQMRDMRKMDLAPVLMMKNLA